MTEPTSWEEFVAAFKYKPGSKLTFEPNQRPIFSVGYLQLSVSVVDVNAPEAKDGKWKLIYVHNRTSVPAFEDLGGYHGARHWVRDMCREIEMHEIDEWFKINGTQPFDPHKAG